MKLTKLMNAIFLKDGIYVLVRNIPNDKASEIKNDSSCVFCNLSVRETILYGGRVKIVRMGGYDTPDYNLYIDGIQIRFFNYSDGIIEIEDVYPIERIVAYLNQIGNLGADTFIQHYKDCVEAFRSEIQSEKNKLEENVDSTINENTSKRIANYDSLLLRLMCILFVFSIHLNAGRENHEYAETYEYFLNIYSE